jgi:aspartyl-tRNA(Asn)/glutamyl-tRNA(Gln) amidotransferase subunit C
VNIDRNEARRIAGLAHLQMDDAALDRMAAGMTKILGYIDQLKELALPEEEAEPVSTTPLRDDVVRPSADRGRIAANAPDWSGGFFVVPQVIGGE